MVWPWHHDIYDVWSPLSDGHHGGEALLINKDFYHVQGGEMINMVRCLEPIVNFLWRNDVRICRVFLGHYHAKGRMIPDLEPSVDGAMDGFLCCTMPATNIPQVKAYYSFQYY